MYHEYNPFFSVTGGHSLCTLDFLYGHCRLNCENFEKYIREIRPQEEKPALAFYYKCLNRACIGDIKKYAREVGFEILFHDGLSSFGENMNEYSAKLEKDVLPDIVKVYPSVKINDLLCDSVVIILEKI